MKPSPAVALWGWPIALAMLSAIGLVGALVGDGAWDWLGWIGLGAPGAAAVWFGWRGLLPLPRSGRGPG